jgi:hypothetical protein
LSLFVVGARLRSYFARVWDADLVAICRGCASSGLFCKGLDADCVAICRGCASSGLFCKGLGCRFCRYLSWVRVFGLILQGSWMQILSLFVVGARPGAYFARVWDADFVAICRGCASLCIFCEGLGCRFCRYLSWVRVFRPILQGSWMQLLTLFVMGARPRAYFARVWDADFVAICRGCASSGLFCKGPGCSFCRYLSWVRVLGLILQGSGMQGRIRKRVKNIWFL